ncbi:unnamed protein product [Thelazia callipaeda]|uniref:RING-type domain-containing protein n=1 Tax=Thelazia callipaeda TaxID=103827 RepID=A0A0N5D0N1_THECL|nr:unnamed protein product [Thelazia callipaeda]
MTRNYARIASLDHHRKCDLIYQIVHTYFKKWKNDLPPSIACRLDHMNDEFRLITEFSVWLSRMSCGYKVNMLSRWQWILHSTISLFIPYMVKRLLPLSIRQARWMYKIVAIFRFANLLQLLLFYHMGGYQNIVERVTQMKVVYKKELGLLNFGALNQQLIWHLFRDFLILLVSMKSEFWKSTKYRSGKDLNAVLCTECAQGVIIPVKNINCGHIRCYTCYHSEPSCATCGNVNTSCFRFLQVSESGS